MKMDITNCDFKPAKIRVRSKSLLTCMSFQRLGVPNRTRGHFRPLSFFWNFKTSPAYLNLINSDDNKKQMIKEFI